MQVLAYAMHTGDKSNGHSLASMSGENCTRRRDQVLHYLPGLPIPRNKTRKDSKDHSGQQGGCTHTADWMRMNVNINTNTNTNTNTDTKTPRHVCGCITLRGEMGMAQLLNLGQRVEGNHRHANLK